MPCVLAFRFKHMKSKYFLIFFLLTGLVSNAQKTANSPKANATKSNVVTPQTFNVVGPTNYESSLIQGKLTLNKKFAKDAGNSGYTLSYTLISSNEKSPIKDKPLEMKLTKDFYETIFLKASPEISDKSASLNKFVTERNISLSDEKGWIEIIRYFNAL